MPLLPAPDPSGPAMDHARQSPIARRERDFTGRVNLCGVSNKRSSPARRWDCDMGLEMNWSFHPITIFCPICNYAYVRGRPARRECTPRFMRATCGCVSRTQSRACRLGRRQQRVPCWREVTSVLISTLDLRHVAYRQAFGLAGRQVRSVAPRPATRPFRGSSLRSFPSRSRSLRQGLNGCTKSSWTAFAWPRASTMAACNS